MKLSSLTSQHDHTDHYGLPTYPECVMQTWLAVWEINLWQQIYNNYSFYKERMTSGLFISIILALLEVYLKNNEEIQTG